MGTLATIGDLLHLVQQSGTWILPDHLPSCCPDPISDIAYQQLDKGIVSAAVCWEGILNPLFTGCGSEPKALKCITKTNAVVDDASEEAKRQSRLISTAVQTMYIMADLAPSSRYLYIHICLLAVSLCSLACFLLHTAHWHGFNLSCLLVDFYSVWLWLLKKVINSIFFAKEGFR